MNKKVKLHLERSISLLDQSFGGGSNSTQKAQDRKDLEISQLRSHLNICQAALLKSRGEVKVLQEKLKQGSSVTRDRQR